MSEPNLNSYEWPKTATGNIDWELLFEDPETGLVPYIEAATAPMTLRLNAVQVIQSLFTRKDDEGEIERLSEEINELIPDDMPENRFPVIAGAVVQAMREIKNYRIRKAEEFDAQKEEGSERRGERGQHSIKKLLRRRNMVIAGSVAASLAAAAAFFMLAPVEKKVEAANLSHGLLAQMQYAVSGGGPTKHIYGGTLRSELQLGNIAVIAAGVPKSACFEVGTGLADTGRVMINSLSPKLGMGGGTNKSIEQICNKASPKITFRWVPDKQ
ncbi:MAG: hypothetical protein HOO19_16170 [Rhodospirillaceae bacterium]|nr:hypothetical protein [Rhodospirillaceae bacterium]MBT3883797.1 hypothetical protein [Rhodospirillaceae bacterium]MBT4115628.1 hypothetical protein [Rhodospirillaceae bacterium]MBT4671334.1 hypothetical protein [Rhodospirillaceae bacterium]MBT4721823.1 hypothetical protein [Rhodospirillaceae bacterium]